MSRLDPSKVSRETRVEDRCRALCKFRGIDPDRKALLPVPIHGEMERTALLEWQTLRREIREFGALCTIFGIKGE